ncbi:MAG: efflux RND transporter permease subunit, partial [Selenomonadales bacterium]|nr:efflux RND transporter permease subunit [Selenomonadales bacterium]
PSTFIPDEDQGFMATSVSLPEGTSLNRTRDLMEKVSADLQATPGVRSVMAICGYDVLSGSTKSNAGTMFVGMEDWDERTADDQQIQAIINKTFGLGAKYPESTILAFNPPSIPGLGIVGGFTMQLMDMTGLSNEELDAITKKFVAAANQRPEVTGVYSTFKMNTPNYRFDVDREKAKNMGVTTSDIFMALQTNFGGYQVNDFNRFGRTYKVMIQADQEFRAEVDGTRFMYVRNNQGEMIPLDTLLTPKFETAPSTISRFNATRAIQINGSAAPGYSSGQAIAAMEEVAKEVLPSGFQVEWSGQSREEKKSSDATAQVIALALVFAFLCLAALYESWSIPIAVLISIPCGIIGAYAAQALVGLQNSIYMQIGLIMIIGLAAKNAILIVEFAKVRFDKGMDAIEAAVEGSKLRFRPILMTSFAFIIGCLPLALATGAGAAARNAMGTAVVGGMLSATIIGVFFIPVFFLLIERIRLRIKGIVQRFAKKHEL